MVYRMELFEKQTVSVDMYRWIMLY